MNTTRKLVAERYAPVADAYRDYWAPVLATFARPLVDDVVARAPSVVIDLGCGPGVISERFAHAGARTIGVDLTPALLALAPTAIERTAGDICHLPIGDGAADAITTTFVLQHIEHASLVFAEAARVLRAGGVFAAATWGPDEAETGGPYAVMETVLDRAGAPHDPTKMQTWHELVDSVEKMTRFADTAGLRTERAWVERGASQWTTDTFIGWATRSGPFGRRFQSLDETIQTRVREQARTQIEVLSLAEMTWTPEVVFLLAVREGRLG